MMNSSGSSGQTRLTGSRARKFAIFLMVLLFCLWGIWFVVIPESLIADYMVEFLQERGVNVVIGGLEKGFPGTVSIEHVTIGLQPHQRSPFSAEGNDAYPVSAYAQRNQKKELQELVIRNLDITPDPLSFLKMSPRLNFNGKTGHGEIHGFVDVKRQGSAVKVDAANLQVRDLAALENVGISGEGNLSFHLDWSEAKGNFKFSINSAKLKGNLPGIGSLPLEFFQSVQGLIGIGDSITLHPLTLKGPGLYVRLKGDIRGSTFDGQVELMMDSSCDHYAFLHVAMARYSQAPGYYVVPGVHANLLSGLTK